MNTIDVSAEYIWGIDQLRQRNSLVNAISEHFVPFPKRVSSNRPVKKHLFWGHTKIGKDFFLSSVFCDSVKCQPSSTISVHWGFTVRFSETLQKKAGRILLDLLKHKQFLMLTNSHREQLLAESRNTTAAVREGGGGKKTTKKLHKYENPTFYSIAS